MRTQKNFDYETPKLTATDVFGKHVSLADNADDYTLLVFLRYSGCPWCNLAINRLTSEYPMLKKQKCDVVTIVQSDKKAIMDNIYGRHNPQPQFPIIADREMKFYKQFDVNGSIVGTLGEITKIPYWIESVRNLGFEQKKIDGNLFLVPAWFLINNKTGKIVKSERGVSFYNHETFTPIYEALIFKE